MFNSNFWQWMPLYPPPEHFTVPPRSYPPIKIEDSAFPEISVPTIRGPEYDVSRL